MTMEEAEKNDPCMHFVDEMIDIVALGVYFDIHRSIRLGYYKLEDIDEESQKDYEIVQAIGFDVFGRPPLKKTIDCVCPNCQRSMAANRFAPHLEKCMGMGRNSSRIASRRIASSGKIDEFDIDDEFDSDWTYEFEKKGRRIRREKQMTNSPRRSKHPPKKVDKVCDSNSRPGTPGSTASGEAVSSGKTGPTLQALESLSSEEKTALLSQTCGAISEHTKKMCTRTSRCVQHSDEQRRSVRQRLLGDMDDYPLPASMRPEGSSIDQDDIHIDVDGYEDMDSGPLLRDLTQIAWEEGSNVSTGSDTAPNIPATNRNSKKKTIRKTRSR